MFLLPHIKKLLSARVALRFEVSLQVALYARTRRAVLVAVALTARVRARAHFATETTHRKAHRVRIRRDRQHFFQLFFDLGLVRVARSFFVVFLPLLECAVPLHPLFILLLLPFFGARRSFELAGANASRVMFAPKHLNDKCSVSRKELEERERLAPRVEPRIKFVV